MSEDNNQKEVHIVKEITRMDSKEYLSIKLKSPDESVDGLLKKALAAVWKLHSAALLRFNFRGFSMLCPYGQSLHLALRISWLPIFD